MAKENRLDEYDQNQLDVFIEKRKLDLNNSIALINKNPKITVTDVAKELNINRSTIQSK